MIQAGSNGPVGGQKARAAANINERLEQLGVKEYMEIEIAAYERYLAAL